MQTSFLQREIFSVIPLANGGAGFIWGEVGMRKIKENLKGHREEELFAYGKRVIFLLSPVMDQGLCVIGTVGLTR